MFVEKAMEKAQHVTETAVNEHWQAFLSIMRDKVGVENITLDEPYLKFEIAKNTLKYLHKLEKIEDTTDNLTLRLNAEKTRHVIRVKQSMDENRQQQFGVTKYVWRTTGDDRVRPEHATKDGKVFAWDEGEVPGEAENCRCSAEPFPEYTGTDDPPLNPVYPLETLLLLWATLGSSVARTIGREVLDWFTDDKPVEPKPETPKPETYQGKEPPEGGRENTHWQFGGHKSDTKWNNQMEKRGWTKEEITDTIKNGKEYEAPNNIRKDDPTATATRYEKDGKFVVRDDQTGELLQVGGLGDFKPLEVPTIK